MRTLLMTLAGVALAVAFDATDSILKDHGRATASDGFRPFVLIWIGIALVDFAMGVAVGNAVSLELAVHAIIFVVPATAAWYLSGRRGRARTGPR